MRRIPGATLPLVRSAAAVLGVGAWRSMVEVKPPPAAVFDPSKVDFESLLPTPAAKGKAQDSPADKTAKTAPKAASAAAKAAPKVPPSPKNATKKPTNPTSAKPPTAAAPATATPAAAKIIGRPKSGPSAKAPGAAAPTPAAAAKQSAQPKTAPPAKAPGRPPKSAQASAPATTPAAATTPKPAASHKAKPAAPAAPTSAPSKTPTPQPASKASPAPPPKITTARIEKVYSDVLKRLSLPVVVVRINRGRVVPAKQKADAAKTQAELSRVLAAGPKQAPKVTVSIQRLAEPEAAEVQKLVDSYVSLLDGALTAGISPPPQVFLLYNKIKAATEKWASPALAPLREQYRTVVKLAFLASCLKWLRVPPPTPTWKKALVRKPGNKAKVAKKKKLVAKAKVVPKQTAAKKTKKKK